jgi:hypothetical protein
MVGGRPEKKNTTKKKQVGVPNTNGLLSLLKVNTFKILKNKI